MTDLGFFFVVKLDLDHHLLIQLVRVLSPAHCL